nr:retrovirus-related Pol polyprotein from transposon TNT 1-94 [Tanacetum cinerariifolium]
MVTSSIEAEYVTAASSCAQVLWIQNQLLDYGPDQTISGKDSSNSLMADNLPKIVWYSTHHVALMKSWLVQKQMALGQTTTGKENSNPFMADIYATGSENRPPMLNKENYVPRSSRLLRYAKSRPNGKLIHNSIINGPYVRRMIPEPGDPNREVLMNETFHVQTDDELTEKELKQIEADDQTIQTILLGLPKDIYAAVDSCEPAQEI